MFKNWEEHQMFVLQELKRLNVNIEKVENKLDCISKDTAVLKVKAGLWGLLGGAIPIMIALGIYILKDLLK